MIHLAKGVVIRIRGGDDDRDPGQTDRRSEECGGAAGSFGFRQSLLDWFSTFFAGSIS